MTSVSHLIDLNATYSTSIPNPLIGPFPSLIYFSSTPSFPYSISSLLFLLLVCSL